MSSKYDKITNYNLSYAILKDAVAEFDGYVLGLSSNNVNTFLGGDTTPVNSGQPTDQALQNFINKLGPSLIDRTTGGYLLNDLIIKDKLSNMPDEVFKSNDVQGATSLMTFVPPNSKSGTKLNSNDFTQSMRTYTESASNEQALEIFLSDVSTEESINQIAAGGTEKFIDTRSLLAYYKADELQEASVIGKDDKEVLDKNGDPKMYPTGIVKASELQHTDALCDGEANRYVSPSLGSVVIQHPKTSIAARGKDHLPIFFNAITPIEMSRCVPYIEIRVVSENYAKNKNGDVVAPGKINNVAFMRFIRQEGSAYVLDDAVGFGDLRPINSATDDAENKASRHKDIGYMDIFTSPQTMANANVNSDGKIGWNKSTYQNKDNPILEPIAPFLSIDSLTVNVTGTGYGLLSSKGAALKLKLHDRSRMKDMSPLLSSAQFATNKIIIEFGWNHPEGSAFSDNTIGKYLNALKDRSVYQVTKCDYSFADGNTVDIDIGLKAFGFRQTERVHAGAGPEVPLNFLSDIISKAGAQLKREKLSAEGKNSDDAPELRQKLKLNQRAARSQDNLISWETYKAIMSAFNNVRDENLVINLVKAILEIELGETEEERSKLADAAVIDILVSEDSGMTSTQQETFISLLKSISLNSHKDHAISYVYGKLDALAETPDPFVTSLTYGANSLPEAKGFSRQSIHDQKAFLKYLVESSDIDTSIGDMITLGKLINVFVGWPLASTGLYDEVQLYFYPINHQAAGGRIHTTASFPIQEKRLREEIQNNFKRSPNLTVDRMFSILERIVGDKDIPAYGLTDIYSRKEQLTSASKEDQAQIIFNGIKDGTVDVSQIEDEYAKELIVEASKGGTDVPSFLEGIKSVSLTPEQTEGKTKEEIKELEEINKETNKELSSIRKELTKLIKKRNQDLNSKIKDDLSAKLEKIYNEDGLSQHYATDITKFIPASIGIDYEVIDAIETQSEVGSSDNIFKKIYKVSTPGAAESDGLKEDTTILRIHIYDEEAVASPSEKTLIDTVTEGANSIVSKDTEFEGKKPSDIDFFEAKQFVKRSYPTVIYGSAGSTINNISVSANTSGGISNVVMIESYGNLRDGDTAGYNYENKFESIVMFPATVTLTMMGMPMIGIGNSIFIDFGTDTSLDNIYTVSGVNHSISAGSFTTSLQLVAANMGAVENFKSALVNSLEKL